MESNAPLLNDGIKHIDAHLMRRLEVMQALKKKKKESFFFFLSLVEIFHFKENSLC